MAKTQVSLYLRIRSGSGSWIFARAAIAKNNQIKPLCAVVNGEIERHPEGSYYIRYNRAGKRAWEAVGDDPSLAQVAMQRKSLELQASALGIAANTEPEPEPDAEPEPVPARTMGDRLIADCIREYIAEVREHKSHKTLLAYRMALIGFAECLTSSKLSRKEVGDGKAIDRLFVSLGDIRMRSISRKTMMDFIAHSRRAGQCPRTIFNRMLFLRTFLKWAGLNSPLKKQDWPKYTEKAVRAYNNFEIGQMFAHASRDEADLLLFLLCTGVRDQEAACACWSDIDLIRKTYTVTEHPDLGFRPKDKEEGDIPIPDVLVEALTERRKRSPRARLVFPGRNGKPNGHALRIVKRLALRAGVNCGHCINRKGLSCANHPVCRQFILHKMRKTFATNLHENGASARTIMRLLRHSDLETTLKYLAGQDDDKTREISSAAFGRFGIVDPTSPLCDAKERL